MLASTAAWPCEEPSLFGKLLFVKLGPPAGSGRASVPVALQAQHQRGCISQVLYIVANRYDMYLVPVYTSEHYDMRLVPARRSRTTCLHIHIWHLHSAASGFVWRLLLLPKGIDFPSVLWHMLAASNMKVPRV